MTVPAHCGGTRLDQLLAQELPEYSRSRLQTWIKEGFVLVDDKQASPSQKLRGLEEISIFIQPSADELAYTAEPIPLNIIYQDDSLIVIDKPAGLVVHPANGNWSGTLLNGLLHHFPELKNIPRAGIVHRLDKDTSGLLVIAKTLIAQTNLVRQLQSRTVTREYFAIVEGNLNVDDTVNAPIGRHPKDRTRMTIMETGKEAITHFKVLDNFSHHTLIRCKLETGRTHQIRVHMQSIGFPLAGDPIYRNKTSNLPTELREATMQLGRQALHAERLALQHPLDNTTMSWESDIPDDLDNLLNTLEEFEEN